MKRLFQSTALLLCLFSAQTIIPVFCQAAVRYELYSWKAGDTWEFSLLPADKGHRMDTEIKHTGGNPLRGPDQVKEKMIDMKDGDVIAWLERKDSGMVYPPKPIIDEIGEYAESLNVKLTTTH